MVAGTPRAAGHRTRHQRSGLRKRCQRGVCVAPAEPTAARLVVCPTRGSRSPARPAASQRNGTAWPEVPPPGAGLAAPGGPPPAPARLSVGRERGIDLADPGEHTTADVDRVGEARVLD